MNSEKHFENNEMLHNGLLTIHDENIGNKKEILDK